MIKLDINYSELESSLQGIATQIGFSAGKIVKEQADQIMAESITQVPSETGTLASTAFVETSNGLGKGEAVFGYSGAAVNPKSGESVGEYMVAVHERLDLAHPQGKAKFLEDPVNDFKEHMEESIGSKIAEVFSSMFRR